MLTGCPGCIKNIHLFSFLQKIKSKEQAAAAFEGVPPPHSFLEPLPFKEETPRKTQPTTWEVPSRPLWGRGLSGAAASSSERALPGQPPSAGAQSPPLPSHPSMALRCSLRPKGVNAAVLPTAETRLLVPHLHRKLGNRKATKGPWALLYAHGVLLRTLRCPCSPRALAAWPGPPHQVAQDVHCSLRGPVRHRRPGQRLPGPSTRAAEPAEAPGSAPSPPVRSGRSLCVVRPRPPWEPLTLTRSPPGKADSGRVSARPRAS